MRVLATNGTIEEIGLEKYRATPITCALAKPAIQAGHIHLYVTLLVISIHDNRCILTIGSWDQYVVSLSKFPQYLEARGAACPSDPNNGLFQFSHETSLESFALWQSKPATLDNFNTLMEGVRADKPSWVEWFPIQDTIFAGSDPASEAPILVDIGGARGHDLIAFDKRFPQSPGKLVLEDLPAVIDDIRSLDPKIKRVKHDFFQPQPIKGARVYFFCHIFHCWPDKDCLRILENLRGAMKKGYSKVIFNEMILPDTGCSFYPACLDWVMLGLHASFDRTAGQWKGLLEAGGFKIDKIWMPPGNGNGVIEASVLDG